MLKMSTEGGQQNKFILTSQIGLVEYWTNIPNIGSSLLLYYAPINVNPVGGGEVRARGGDLIPETIPLSGV